MRFYPPLAFWKTCLARPRPRPWELLAIILGWSMPWGVLANISGTHPIIFLFHPQCRNTILLACPPSSCVPVPAMVGRICYALVCVDEHPSPWLLSPPINPNQSSLPPHRRHLKGSRCGHGCDNGRWGDGWCKGFGIRAAEKELNMVPSRYTRSSHAIATPSSWSSVAACHTHCTSTAAARSARSHGVGMC